MRFLNRISITVFFILLSNTQAQTDGLLRYISVENTKILSDGKLQEGGRIYPASVSGNSSLPSIYSDSYSGQKSLLFQTPAAISTQRYEFKFCDYDQLDALKYTDERYVGFAVKIPDNFDPLQGSVIFFQAWQGYPWGPPMMLKVSSGSNPYRVRFTIRNNSTGPDSEISDQEIWTDSMLKNQWYTFVIGMKPRVAGDSSRIQIWMDDQKVLTWENEGNIGYDPDTFLSEKPYPTLCLKFGIYQPGSNTKHSLLFDEIRYADNYHDAVPVKSVGIETENEESIISNFILNQNFPNPFNSTTTISYHLPKSSKVKLDVLNIFGELVKTLVYGQMEMGYHEIRWLVPNSVSSGIYFYRMEYEEHLFTKKLLLLK